MKKVYAMILTITILSTIGLAASEINRDIAVSKIYPYYYNDYPDLLVFKGTAVTKSYDSYPAILVATNTKTTYNPETWLSDDSRFYFILDNDVHILELEKVKSEPEKNLVILEFSENGNSKKLISTARYTKYRNDLLLSGVYDKKYLLNMNLAQNMPVYEILEKMATQTTAESIIEETEASIQPTEADDWF